MQAVEVLKDTQQRQELTQDRVNEIVNQYLEYVNNPGTNSNNEAYHYLSEEPMHTGTMVPSPTFMASAAEISATENSSPPK